MHLRTTYLSTHQTSLEVRSDKQNVHTSWKKAKYVYFFQHDRVVHTAEGSMPSPTCHCGNHSAYEVPC